MAAFATPRRSLGASLISLGTVLVMVAALLVFLAGPAFAHHPEISADDTCTRNPTGADEFQVFWTSTTWDYTHNPPDPMPTNRQHNDIEIWIRSGSHPGSGGSGFNTSGWTRILDNGVFDYGNGGVLNGSLFLASGTWTIRSLAVGPWVSGTGGDEYRSYVFEVDDDCPDPTTTTTTSTTTTTTSTSTTTTTEPPATTSTTTTTSTTSSTTLPPSTTSTSTSTSTSTTAPVTTSTLPPELPRTGIEGNGLIVMLGGLGLALMGAGLLVMADERRRYNAIG